MNAERWCAANRSTSSAPSRELTASKARFNGHAPPVCTVSMRGEPRPSSAPSATASANAWMQALASAPPPTCTTSRSSGTPEETSLPAERLARLDRQSVQASLAREGQGAVGERLQEPAIGGVAGQAVAASQRLDAGTQLLKPGEHDRVGVDRDEDPQRPAAGRGHHRRREGRVPAARDGEAAGWREGSASPIRSATSSCTSTPKRWRALCEPETLPVSSFTQRRRLGSARPSARLSAELRAKGVTAEAVPVDGRDGVVKPPDELAVAVVREAPRSRQVVGVEEAAVADEGVGPAVVAAGELDRGRVENPAQDVVDVVARGRRSGIETAYGSAGAVVAPQPAQTSCEGRRSSTATPARRCWALSSSIMLVPDVHGAAEAAPEGRGRAAPGSPRARLPAARPR